MKSTRSRIYCTNCGKTGHEYKKCTDATISTGIILIKCDYSHDIVQRIITNMEAINIKNTAISIDSTDDISVFSDIKEKIKFLLIKRKHSLGYIDFVRGRYKSDNVDGIVFLFQQMTSEEIEKIGSYSIEQLWDDLWIDADKKVLYEREFTKSKQKFERIKSGDGGLTLDYYVKNVAPSWNLAEWGFPKGRRNKLESDLDCAKREFEEESGFTKDDYVIATAIEPFVEDFLGTNGVRYKHIYYVAFATTQRVPGINTQNSHQRGEIGDIAFFTYNETLDIIRSYHLERKKIVMSLYMYILESFIREINK